MVRSRIWALGLLGMAAVGVACFGDVVASVHFNSAGADFSVPPSSLVLNVWGERETRDVSTTLYDGGVPYERLQSAEAALTRSQASALAAPTPEHLRAAAKAAEALVALGDRTFDVDFVESARNRAEVLAIAARTKTALLRRYLRDRAAVDAGERNRFRPIGESFAKDPLFPHLVYLHGIALYDAGRLAEAASVFERVASFKGSPRRAPALIMVARSLLRADAPTASDFARAGAALDTLDRDFPKSRFAWDARNWRARIALLKGRKADALATYLRLLDTAGDMGDRINALASIRTVTRGLDAGASAARSARGFSGSPTSCARTSTTASTTPRSTPPRARGSTPSCRRPRRGRPRRAGT